MSPDSDAAKSGFAAGPHIALARPNVLLAVSSALVLLVFLLCNGHYLLSALVLAGIYTVAVLGLVLLIGLNGQYSLGHAGFFGIGAYTSAILARANVPPPFATVAAVLDTAAVAVLIGIPLLRLRGYYLSLATLAFGLIISSVLTGWRSVTLGPSGMGDIPPFAFGAWVIRSEGAHYWLVWSMALLCIWAALNLWRSRPGQAMLAVKNDEAAAAAMGINVALAKMQIFAISAGLAGLAGALYAHYVKFIAPERFGTIPSFELLLAALLGGVGSPYGAILGALLLIALPEIVVPLQDYKVIAYGVIFVVVSLYAPHGIAGLIRGHIGRLLRAGR
jgi:branched-chain amino acid transport system permease protein